MLEKRKASKAILQKSFVPHCTAAQSIKTTEAGKVGEM